MFFHCCSLEPMCLFLAWLTDLVHVKSHWSVLGRLQGHVGTSHNLRYTVRAFRLLAYGFVLAAMGKIEEPMLSSTFRLCSEIGLVLTLIFLMIMFYRCFIFRKDEGRIPIAQN